MNGKLLTIFTPTYNRKKLLLEVYNSLKKQTSQNFTWLIVDDGSTDGTLDEVKKWISEGRVDIQYHYQNNAGKPSATNYSIGACETALWVCLDSDDVFTENGVALIEKYYPLIENDLSCAALVTNKYSIKTLEVQGQDGKNKYKQVLPRDGLISYIDMYYKGKNRADLVYIYKTNILKGYRYPLIPSEKFIGESYLFEEIGLAYKYYMFREQIYLCEYLNDGLTSGYKRLHINNPKGYKLLKFKVMVYPKPLVDQIKGAIMYVAGCKLCRDNNIISNSPRKILTLIAYLPGLLAYRLKYQKAIEKGENL